MQFTNYIRNLIADIVLPNISSAQVCDARNDATKYYRGIIKNHLTKTTSDIKNNN